MWREILRALREFYVVAKDFICEEGQYCFDAVPLAFVNLIVDGLYWNHGYTKVFETVEGTGVLDGEGVME